MEVSKDDKMTITNYALWAPRTETYLESQGLSYVIKYSSFREFRRNGMTYPSMMAEYDDKKDALKKDKTLSKEKLEEKLEILDEKYMKDRRAYKAKLDKAEEEWNKSDEKARAMIKLRVNAIALKEIETKKSAYDMWKRFCRIWSSRREPSTN